ncbi:MAG: DUF3899 domain-containing protein [Treponema sp.]|jgi:hypothetical protein|nr:DUF3899 domain-containing protein [Treponema sp.]
MSEENSYSENRVPVPHRPAGKWHYLSAAVAAGFLFFITAVYEYSRLPHTRVNGIRVICDGFFIPGIILICAGCFTAVANYGGFTAFTYGFSVLFHRLSSPGKYGRDEEKLTYTEYVQEKSKKISPTKHLFIVGLCCIGLSAVFLLVFNHMSSAVR